MKDWILSVTNSVNYNVDLFSFYGTDQEVCHKIQAMALEDCQECRSSDLQVDDSNNTQYAHQYQLVVSHSDGETIYTATEFAAINSI